MMRRNEHLARTATALALLLIAGNALAWIREMNAKEDGKGWINIEGRRPIDVDRLSVILHSDGSMQIKQLRDETITFEGTWRNDGRDRVRLRIDEMNRRRAEGTGFVELGRGDTFDVVSLSGTSGRDRFRLEFARKGVRFDSRPNDRPGRYDDDRYNDPRTYRGPISISRTHNSRGRYEFYRGFAVLKRAHVKVDRDGRFEISFWGDRNDRVSGTWTNVNGRLRLTVTRGFGDRACTGDGWMDVDARNGDWVQFSLDGGTGRDHWSLTFLPEKR